MSKKYYERVLSSSTIGSSTPFTSSFGSSILKKFGWTEGQGLGRDGTGITSCITVKKRKEGLGLGATARHGDSNEWDNWWDGLYNQVASRIMVDENSSSDTSDDDSPPTSLSINSTHSASTFYQETTASTLSSDSTSYQETTASTLSSGCKSYQETTASTSVNESMEKTKKKKKIKLVKKSLKIDSLEPVSVKKTGIKKKKKKFVLT